MSGGESLSGRTAVVTGGSRGIGAEVVRTLAGLGAAVVLNYRHSKQLAEQLRDEIGADKVMVHQADVGRADDVEALAAATRERFGDVDILVGNAGRANERKPLAALEWSDFERQIEVTLRGTLHCFQAFVPGMMERGWGRIITIGSIAVHQPTPGSYAYLTAKGGLAAFTRTLAVETAGSGVTANLVEPALVLTDRADAFSAEFLEEYAAEIPVGRIATPGDVAAAVAFLASEEAGYLTGVSLNLSGGKFMDT